MIDLNSNENVFKGLTELSKADISELVYKRIYIDDPVLFEKFGEQGKKNIMKDVLFHLSYLDSAYQANEPKLFIDYVIWCKMYFNSIKLPLKWIYRGFELLRDVLKETLRNDGNNMPVNTLNTILAEFNEYPTDSNSFLAGDARLGVLAQQYLNALLRKERQTASRLINHALTQGTSIKDIYLNVFQTTQYEVGRLWQTNKISVAMEHYCTASTQLIMSQLYSYIFDNEKNGKKLVATSVSGELHELGIRMVSDFFEMDGWDTYYLGANTPHDSVIHMINETKADLLAISATMPVHLSKVRNLISDVRKDDFAKNVRILVGGKPFNDNPDLWVNVNADGFGYTAQDAIEKAELLIKKS